MVPPSEKEAGGGGQPFFEYIQQLLARAQIPYEFPLSSDRFCFERNRRCYLFFSKELVKGVILQIDDRFVMVVLPIKAAVDLEIVKISFRSISSGLQPPEVHRLFENIHPDIPPSPNKWNPPPVYVDLTLLENEKIAFSTGRGNPLIRMKTVDFLKRVSPSFGSFCLPSTVSAL